MEKPKMPKNAPWNLFDGSEYASIDWVEWGKEKHIQRPISGYNRDKATQVKFDIPGEWSEYILQMAKKLKIQPEFLYRKAFQAFFGLNPAIFTDDGYLRQWAEIYALDGEKALREHIQGEDDVITFKIVRERNKKKTK